MGQSQRTTTRRGGSRSISLEDIDADYERKGAALGADDAKKAAYFGDVLIGPMGIAMAVHRRLWLDNRAITAHAFGLKLESAIKSSSPIGEVPPNLDADHLRAWVQASRPVALPDPQHASTVLIALQEVAREARIQEHLVAALAEPWQRPSQLLIKLRDLPDVGWGEHFHPIDQAFLSRFDPEARYEATARLIGDAFVGDLGKSHIVMVVGPRYSGKRRAVISMIQSRRIGESHFLDVPGQGRLPLFARNVEGLPIERVIWDLAAFLRIDASDDGVPPSVDRLIEEIADACRRPEFAAAYILAEVPAPGDLLSRLLGRERLVRLLNALSPPGGQTRLLLTGTESHWLQVGRPVYPIPLSELPRLQEIARKHGLPALGAHSEARTDGPLATLIDTLLNPSWDRTDNLRERARLVSAQALTMFSSSTGSVIDNIPRPDLTLLAEEIFHQLGSAADALEVLQFLCLSEDGLRASSLAELRRNNDQFSTHFQYQFDSCTMELHSNLRLVCRHIEWAGPWPSENAPERDEATRLEPLLELLPPFRRIFEAAFARLNIIEFRRKNWAVARLARQQSRWKRLSTDSRGRAVPFDLIRDAQALRRAQIGLEPSSEGAQPTISGSINYLASSIDRLVFSGDGLPFRESYKFLYFDVFLDDIDSRHRLSMYFDRDDLRLNLLLGFCNPGMPIYVESNGADHVEKANWELVTQLLPSAALSELLISIAVAAKRVGAWTIVQAIARQAVLFSKRGLTTFGSIERVLRCDIDTHILRCGARGAIQNFSDIRSRIQALVEQYSSEPESWKAQIKLNMRLGEVNYLMGDFSSAQNAFAEAEDRAYSSAQVEMRAESKWERSPILGHGARKYLKMLCEVAQSEGNVLARTEILEKANDLYITNTRRLARFPAERQLLILDQAMIAKCSGNLEQSYNLLLKIPAYTSMGITSLSARIEFEFTLAKLCLDLLELIGGQCVEQRVWLAATAKMAIDSILRLAGTSELPLYQAFGEMLAAQWIDLRQSDRSEHEGSLFDDRTSAELSKAASSTLIAVECGLFQR